MNIGVYLVGRGVGDDELALEVQLRQLQHQDRREGVVQQEGRPSDTTLRYETEIMRFEANLFNDLLFLRTLQVT